MPTTAARPLEPAVSVQCGTPILGTAARRRSVVAKSGPLSACGAIHKGDDLPHVGNWRGPRSGDALMFFDYYRLNELAAFW